VPTSQAIVRGGSPLIPDRFRGADPGLPLNTRTGDPSRAAANEANPSGRRLRPRIRTNEFGRVPSEPERVGRANGFPRLHVRTRAVLQAAERDCETHHRSAPSTGTGDRSHAALGLPNPSGRPACTKPARTDSSRCRANPSAWDARTDSAGSHARTQAGKAEADPAAAPPRADSLWARRQPEGEMHERIPRRGTREPEGRHRVSSSRSRPASSGPAPHFQIGRPEPGRP
jgi:hypothetical protein